MRSEFEKYFKENHADSFYSVDAALEMRGDDYIDFHAADLWALWQHQQSKVDELQKQRDSFIKAYEIEMNESVELQKRLDAALELCGRCGVLGAPLAVSIEQALKGGSNHE